MKNIISSSLLESALSTFNIDLVKHCNGLVYLSIRQTIHHDSKENSIQEIKLNPSIIKDLIAIVELYQQQINKIETPTEYYSKERQKRMIEIYLKGVSIPDIAIQFDYDRFIIEQILLNNDIKVVDDVLPFKNRKRRNRQH